MKKFYITTSIFILLFGLGYVAFYNDEAWRARKGRIFSDLNYLEEPHVMAMIEKQLYEVDYAAIAYASQTRTTPNSWFHRVVMKSPYDSTYYTIKAEVDHTILGNDYDTVTYASASRADSNENKEKPAFATLVMLCGNSPDNMYAPENGYEFAVSKELYNYLRKRKKIAPQDKKTSVCSD